MDMNEVRKLDKHQASTVGMYLARIWSLGIEIDLEKNTAVSFREWSKDILQSRSTPFLNTLELYSVEGHKDHGQMLRNFMHQPSDVDLTPDQYVEHLTTTLKSTNDFIKNLETLPEDMANFSVKNQAYKLGDKLNSTLFKTKNLIWELNDELDDLYVSLYKAKDAYEYNNKLGGYKK